MCIRDRFNVSLPALIKDLDARDKRDRERDNSPLVIPEGASVIETDNLKINQVKELTMKMVNKTYGTNISRVILKLSVQSKYKAWTNYRGKCYQYNNRSRCP